ncbi:MAG: hypothetical protein V4649_06170 [Bacteroidota bacterium]
MKAKLIILFSVCFTACIQSIAQVRTDISMKERNNSSLSTSDFSAYNSNDYSLGVGLGSSKMYGDLPYSNPQPVYIADFNKNLKAYFILGWQVSIGDLSSRDPYTHMRSFNHFTSVQQNVTMEMGALFSLFDKSYDENPLLYLLSGAYVGTGIGIINNDVKRIADVNVEVLPGITSSSNPPILTNSTALFIPINVGYNLHIPKLWKFKGAMFYANFQYTNTLSDYVDGYKLPFKANKKNDVYTVMSIGFRFYILHTDRNIEIEY